jgi:MFS transporter, DHA1 family, multidrug resistance protein
MVAGLTIFGSLSIDAYLPAPFLVPLALVFTPMGLIGANSQALAMADHPEIAGTASAFLGVIGFSMGGLAIPLVGIAGTNTAVPMALLIATFQLGAFFAFRILTRPELTAAEKRTATVLAGQLVTPAPLEVLADPPPALVRAPDKV